MSGIIIQNLNKTYRNGVVALRDVSLEIPEGNFFALLGPNGAGKSTLIGILSSLLLKTSGHVTLFGHDLEAESHALKAKLGVVPQELNFNGFETVEQIITNQAGYYGLSRRDLGTSVQDLLQGLSLWEKHKSQARLLSGGMKRRLMIARALIHKPRVLILDEPTAGVDVELRRSMWDFLRTLNEQGTTIILTTHYLEEAEQLCETIAIINHGEIVTCTNKKALLERLDTVSYVFDAIDLPAGGIKHADFQFILKGPSALEVKLKQDQLLSDVFAYLSAEGIRVKGLLQQTHRLEELFLNLTETTHT